MSHFCLLGDPENYDVDIAFLLKFNAEILDLLSVNSIFNSPLFKLSNNLVFANFVLNK